MATASPGPLSGVVVLDLSSVGPAARCTRLLADYGATVVKVGPVPGQGPAPVTPPFLAYSAQRGMRRVQIDVRDAEGRDAFLVSGGRRRRGGRELPARRRRPPRHWLRGRPGRERRRRLLLDERFRPGRPARRVGRARPQLPRRGRIPRHIAAACRRGPPIPGATIADGAGGGMHAALAMCAALAGRAGTGEGAYLDVSVADGVLWLMSLTADENLATGTEPGPGHDVLTGRYACYDTYRAADGKWLSVAAIEGKFFANLCRALDCGQWVEHQYDDEAQDDVRRDFAAAFARRRRDEWVEELSGADTCVAPVQAVAEIGADPQYAWRGAVVEAKHAGRGAFRQVGAVLAGMTAPTEPVVRARRRGDRHRRAAHRSRHAGSPGGCNCVPGRWWHERGGRGGARPHRRTPVRGDRRVPGRAQLHLDHVRGGGERQPAVLGRRRGGRAHRRPHRAPTMLSVWFRPHHWAPGRTEEHLPLKVHFDLKERLGLPEAVMTDNTIVFHEPVRPGDVLTTRQFLRSVSDEKRTKLGTGRFWVIDVEYTNQHGDRSESRATPGSATGGAGERSDPVLDFGDVAEGDIMPPLSTRCRPRRSCWAPWPPRLATDAPRQGLRRRAQRDEGHLPQHPQPGGVVRALHHGLDRAARPHGPGHVPHARLGVPGDTMVLEGVVCEVGRWTTWVAAGSASTSRCRSTGTSRDVRRADGGARGRRRQPVAPAPRTLEALRGAGRRSTSNSPRSRSMLRETVREPLRRDMPRCRWCARSRTIPLGYPPVFWKQMAGLDLIGLLLPEEHGGSAMGALDGVVALRGVGRGAGAHARTSPALCCAARRPGPGGFGGQKAAVAPAHRGGEAILTPAWFEPETAAARPACRCGPSRRRRLPAHRHQAPRPLRGPRRRGSWSLAGTGDAESDVDLLLVDPAAAGCDHGPADDGGVRHPVPGDLRRRARRRRGPHRRPAVGVGDVGRRHARRVHPPRRPGHGRGPAGSRHHRAVRQGPRAVRQASRCLPGHRPLPGRRRHRRRRGPTLVHEAAWARLRGPVRRRSGAHGQALRLPDLPRRHGHGPAGVRRHRVHGRLRHPALLPPGQGAPGVVVGQPLP